MSGMNMPVPRNSLCMSEADGPFGKIEMGGMFHDSQSPRRHHQL